MKQRTNFTDQFLPEAGVMIFDVSLDVYQLDSDTAMRYWLIAKDYLASTSPDIESRSYYEKLQPIRIDREWGICWDIYDDLEMMLGNLQSQFPTKTQLQIIRQLEHRENLNAETF